MNSLLLGIAYLFSLLAVKSQAFESINIINNTAFLDKKDNSCSSNIPDVLYGISLTLFCPFKPIEWIYRTQPAGAWKYNLLTVERQYVNFTIDNAKEDGCVCCRSILDFSLACLQVMIATGPKELNISDLIEPYCLKPFDVECPYIGYPELNYTWVFWREFYSETEVIIPEIKDQLHNRILHFDKYSPSLRGKYKCIAENIYGIKGNSSTINGVVSHGGPRYSLSAPKGCVSYGSSIRADLSEEYTGVIGGNVTMSCTSQYGCQFIEDCLEHIKWDESAFPPDRTLRISGSSCSTCTNYKNRTIFNLQASDFNKIYSCNITNKNGDAFKNTTLKPASQNTQTFNPLPALLPTVLILVTLTIITTTSIILGIYYKRKITMFFYYRLAKEPPYVKGLQYDVFISFASLDKDFVEEKIHNRIKDSGYKVIWYPDDFLAGEVILQQAKDSIWKSRKTIMCLSENFLASDYCAAEKDYCFEKAMETFKNFLIVIHLDNCEIPSDMKKLKIIDMKMDSSDNHLKPFSNVKYLLKAPVDKVQN